jgi:hypothetical protein
MRMIRSRLDSVREISTLGVDDYHKAENAAFQGRKIIEGIAFSCLVAVENGLQNIPREAKGQYNAEKLLKNLQKNNIKVLPNPSILRPAEENEIIEHNVSVVVDGQPEKVLSHEEIIAIYRRFHCWLHELNPYTKSNHKSFHENNSEQLWIDLDSLENLVSRHFISISGEGFFCTLRDANDNATKVVSLSKVGG